jgi:hypothetical protein
VSRRRRRIMGADGNEVIVEYNSEEEVPMGARDEAKNLLNHYVWTMMRASGLYPDRDTTAELDELVDKIIDAAAEETLRRIDNRRE